MSASKAKLIDYLDRAADVIDRQEADIIFLLQALIDIKHEHPAVELPDLGNNRFPERIWRRIATHD